MLHYLMTLILLHQAPISFSSNGFLSGSSILSNNIRERSIADEYNVGVIDEDSSLGITRSDDCIKNYGSRIFDILVNHHDKADSKRCLKLNKRNARIPSIPMPDLPSLPKVEEIHKLPSIDKPNLTNIDVPEIPKVELPEVKIPDLNKLPKIDLQNNPKTNSLGEVLYKTLNIPNETKNLKNLDVNNNKNNKKRSVDPTQKAQYSLDKPTYELSLINQKRIPSEMAFMVNTQYPNYDIMQFAKIISPLKRSLSKLNRNKNTSWKNRGSQFPNIPNRKERDLTKLKLQEDNGLTEKKLFFNQMQAQIGVFPIELDNEQIIASGDSVSSDEQNVTESLRSSDFGMDSDSFKIDENQMHAEHLFAFERESVILESKLLNNSSREEKRISQTIDNEIIIAEQQDENSVQEDQEISMYKSKTVAINELSIPTDESDPSNTSNKLNMFGSLDIINTNVVAADGNELKTIHHNSINVMENVDIENSSFDEGKSDEYTRLQTVEDESDEHHDCNCDEDTRNKREVNENGHKYSTKLFGNHDKEGAKFNFVYKPVLDVGDKDYETDSSDEESQVSGSNYDDSEYNQDNNDNLQVQKNLNGIEDSTNKHLYPIKLNILLSNWGKLKSIKTLSREKRNYFNKETEPISRRRNSKLNNKISDLQQLSNSLNYYNRNKRMALPTENSVTDDEVPEANNDIPPPMPKPDDNKPEVNSVSTTMNPPPKTAAMTTSTTTSKTAKGTSEFDGEETTTVEEDYDVGEEPCPTDIFGVAMTKVRCVFNSITSKIVGVEFGPGCCDG